MAKEGLIASQAMLGVAQTADGLPLYHEVFDDNLAELTISRPIMEIIVQLSRQLFDRRARSRVAVDQQSQ
jgi:hypothetical protein